jgi:IclR family acetate operon transcriptional repressor
MATKSTDGDNINAVETTFAIIELVDEKERIGVSEVADELSIAKSTAHKHLRTLESNEYLVRRGQKYSVSLKPLKYGQHALNRTTIAQESQPVIDHLAEETGEAIWVAIEEHGRVVYVNKALGDRAAPSRGGIGERILLHTAAIGKAMLSQFSEDRIDEIIDRHGLPGLTDKSITDRESLLSELETIREQGVAFNDGESLRGLRAVASPVVHEQEVMGAIAIVGAANRMKGDYFREELADLVQGAANEIELNLAYPQ